MKHKLKNRNICPRNSEDVKKSLVFSAVRVKFLTSFFRIRNVARKIFEGQQVGKRVVRELKFV